MAQQELCSTLPVQSRMRSITSLLVVDDSFQGNINTAGVLVCAERPGTGLQASIPCSAGEALASIAFCQPYCINPVYGVFYQRGLGSDLINDLVDWLGLDHSELPY
ncbi:hypothetical protein SUNI508_12954 [Seiridium unicorne]|uniref:Uncharacterized protein n=1 Tax=Seiridium unicorne TaxID=138068 RepID=A0ABR2VF04_9PEZI